MSDDSCVLILRRLRGVLNGVVPGTSFDADQFSPLRAMLTGGDSVGRVWSPASARSWENKGRDHRLYWAHQHDRYGGILERAPFRIHADFPGYELYVEKVEVDLPTRRLVIGEGLHGHSGIKPKFYDGPWWCDMPQWLDELQLALDAEKRRLAILMRDRQLEKDRAAEVVRAGDAAEYVSAKYGARR